MIVTDKRFFMEEMLVRKLELMVKRINGKDDVVLIGDGDEGMGKTNLGAGICYYMSYRTGRKFDVDHIFFDLDKMIDFATKTEAQILMWDEGALGGLGMEWWKKNQKKFIKFLMVARKKRHFLFICIPKFHKLQEYIVLDRSIGLIHVYARNNIQKGRFFYYTKQKKEILYDTWRRTRYKGYAKYRAFGGSFLEYMPKIFTQEQIDAYERKKDRAIMSVAVDEKDESKEMKELHALKYKVSQIKGLMQKELAVELGVSPRTLRNWSSLSEEQQIEAPV